MPPTLKIAVIGAGSFVFGPSILHQVIHEYALQDIEIALMDVDAAMLALMAATGNRMAADACVRICITTTTRQSEALEGADFVVCCAAPQMRSRHETDRAIIQRLYPETPMTEFGGLAGLSYSLRQMAFVRGLAAAMKTHCPGAWLLSVSNPLPRVCQAAHEAGEGHIKVAGFCYYALAAYPEVLEILGQPHEPYPWTAARAKYDLTIGGLNHFSWITAARERATGADLMPRIREALAARKSAGNPRNEAVSQETGYFLIGADDHVASDFLAPAGKQEYFSPFHGTAEERVHRLQALQDYANGGGSLADVMRDASWEKPVELVAALTANRPGFFPTLNLINDGQIPNLPRQVFAQTACSADSSGVTPIAVSLPDSVLPYCQSVAAVTDAIVRAGRERSLRAVDEVIELDPTIEDKTRGRQAAHEIVATHADMIGVFS